MGKLVRTAAGRMIDLVLDIRKGSPCFGKIIAYDMPCTAEQSYGEWIWVPPGFAHGNVFPGADANRVSLQRRVESGLRGGHFSAGRRPGLVVVRRRRARPSWTVPRPGDLLISDKDRDGLTLTQWRDDPRSENFLYGRL